MHSIPISGVDGESEFLDLLPPGALPHGVTISQRQKAHGLNMDAATLNLLIEGGKVLKDILVPTIGAIGSVWAATVAARAGKEKDNKAHSSERSQTVPAVEIDTISETYTIIADDNLSKHIREALPESVNSVLNIRLTRIPKPDGR